MRWLVIIGLCIDGLWKPERHVPVDAGRVLAAVRKAIPEACRLAGVPQHSTRISDVTIKTRTVF